MCFQRNECYLKPGVLLPARILFILIDAPWMQLSAADTLKICPPFEEILFGKKKLVNYVYKTHEKLRVLSTITKKNDWQTNTHPFHYTSVHLERCCGHFREMREIVTNCPRARLQSTPPTRDARTGIEKRDGAQLPNCGEVIISRCVAHKQCGDKRELLTVPRAQPTSSQN